MSEIEDVLKGLGGVLGQSSKGKGGSAFKVSGGTNQGGAKQVRGTLLVKLKENGMGSMFDVWREPGWAGGWAKSGCKTNAAWPDGVAKSSPSFWFSIGSVPGVVCGYGGVQKVVKNELPLYIKSPVPFLSFKDGIIKVAHAQKFTQNWWLCVFVQKPFFEEYGEECFPVDETTFTYAVLEDKECAILFS
ncbi:hypothetical protein SERLADRAFT_404846 [Serpula lacrymans var. lacrymans S7.9]|uniref:Uncharacterized protein n=1 Tax=Serpula lacrymans var. lacrymans (strain S7.9) TaxID=578457 RepID=F8NFL9_SERL9|nr:uncharacterized protein SERLADRAFT_404846 [Serpula lacrymans var. lacrymans S7.9]EGO30859.1 hypothetical protein SERLADRAFT_404846 [Serpula lacrymans var. lacrymans S7.9]